MVVYLSLFLIGLASGCMVFFRKKLKAFMPVILSFSGAYLLGICFLHLLPELFEGETDVNLGIYLLLGFFLQLVLDYFSGGIEHGHAHVDHKRIGRFPWLIFISLCIHALIEAFPLQELNEEAQIGSYLGGLLLHKIPITFILASLLVEYRLKKSIIIIGILLFSLMGPIGIWTGSFLNESELLFKQLLSVSVGIILHLSTTILLETNEEHTIQWKKLLPMLGGAILALFSLWGH